jgi:hypothetical protein
VRYPRGTGPGVKIDKGRRPHPHRPGRTAPQGQDVALLAFGSRVAAAEAGRRKLGLTVANMRFIKPLDEALILELADRHRLLVTVEENSIAGGAGSAVSELLAEHGVTVHCLHLGLPDACIEQGGHDEQLAACGLTMRRASSEYRLRAGVPDLTYSGEVGRLRVGSGAAIVSNPDAGEWRFVGEIGTMEAEAPDGRRLRVSGINVAIALAPLGGVLPVNALTIEVGELLLDATASDPAFSLEGLAVQLTGVERDSTADLRVSAAVTSLALGGDGYAPSKLALTLAGIDVGGLRTLRSRLGALGARSLAPSQRGLATARLLQASLPELFSGEPLFALEQLEVTTPFGLLAAEADLALAAAPPSPVVSGRDAAATGTGSPGDDASPRLAGQTGWEPLRSLTRRLSGTGRWSAPQSLAVALVAGQQATRVRRELALRGEGGESLPPGLAAEVESASQSAVAGLLRDGWLTADQGRLAAEFRVEGGAVQINGRPVAMTGWFADERGSR